MIKRTLRFLIKPERDYFSRKGTEKKKKTMNFSKGLCVWCDEKRIFSQSQRIRLET